MFDENKTLYYNNIGYNELLNMTCDKSMSEWKKNVLSLKISHK